MINGLNRKVFKIHDIKNKDIIFVRSCGELKNYQGTTFYYCTKETDLELLKDYIRLGCRHNNANVEYHTNIIITEKDNKFKLNKFYGDNTNYYSVEVI